jgi:hypothetical protein
VPPIAGESLRRHRGVEEHATALELFYDLVFVFAVTQVSHLLLDHLTWQGAGQATLVLLVVWWSWNYTTWATNELNPSSIAVRLPLIALMLASLCLQATRRWPNDRPRGCCWSSETALAPALLDRRLRSSHSACRRVLLRHDR